MVMIKDKDGVDRFYVSDSEVQFLMRLREKAFEEDDEGYIIFCGAKSSGKSVKAQHWAKVIDPNFEGDGARDKILFYSKPFVRAINKHKKSVIIADEGVNIFYNRDAMTREGKNINKHMDKIRAQNNIIFICIPNPLKLDSSLLEDESLRAVVRVYKKVDKTEKGKNNITKGNINAYLNLEGNKGATRYINYLKKIKKNPNKFVKMPWPSIIDHGTSIKNPPWYPPGEEWYRKRKESLIGDDQDEETDTKRIRRRRIDKVYLDRLLRENKPTSQIMKILDCSKNAVCTRRRMLKASNELPNVVPKKQFVVPKKLLLVHNSDENVLFEGNEVTY